MSDDKLIAIVVLNYNGYSDTIDCLKSLEDLTYSPYVVVLIDNASIDDSVGRITDCFSNRFALHFVDNDDSPSQTVAMFHEGTRDSGSEEYSQLFLVQNRENIGFAAGCNQGIRLALSMGSHYIWLLNNDTVVDSDSLLILANYLSDHPACQVATPQIRLFNEPDRIWNCGGLLKWYGARKYFFVHRPVTELPEQEKIDITFVTGCAPLIRSSLLQEKGGFTEKFFFGEEDYEFSLRMKKAKVKMVCCLKSVIYHKVGMSVDRSSNDSFIGRIYIHYLNRFINLRSYWPYFFWYGWRLIYAGYIDRLLRKKTDCRPFDRYRFIKKLMQDSREMNGVDRQTFLKILNDPSAYFEKP
ncbi:MAG: glycosyltransferase family 2 protein [Deltaproteobacteria bacterium]|nr:glycosyltransferase family 2 protein [Deltaproteobacteria bacterium]